jgi:hypothetical protein
MCFSLPQGEMLGLKYSSPPQGERLGEGVVFHKIHPHPNPSRERGL